MTDASSSAETQAASTSRPRESPRFFWVGMAVFLIVMVGLGFGSTYGRQLVLGQDISGVGVVDTDWVIHLHAAVFVGWMMFFLVQTILMARGRSRLHVSAGTYGGALMAVAIFGAGLLITYMQIEGLVSRGIFTWSEWPGILVATMTPWGALVVFGVLLGLGLLYRSRPEVHKRYMALATVGLAAAATQRMEYLLGFQSIYVLECIGIGAMVLPLFVYDLYTDGRVHWPTLIGTGILYLFIGIRASRPLFG
jgi:hypothetical protein